MENIDNFSFNSNKYIILYSDSCDKEYDISISSYLKEKYDISIIKFLSLKDEKINNILIDEVYIDSSIENILIQNSLCVIYISNIVRSKKIVDLLKLYNKYIIFKKEKVIDDFNLFLKYYNNNNNNDISLTDVSLADVIYYSINNFEGVFNNLKLNTLLNNNNNNINIKVQYNKILKSYNDDKINIITYYKHYDLELLNIIQKKCIFENLKNKYINKVVVIGDKLDERLKDIFKNNESKNLITEQFLINEEFIDLSFKDIFEIINKKYINKVFCILRSDIILPNQESLEDIEIDMEEYDKKVYCISRIERLITGNLIKYDKLNKIFYSSEQDAWIFKSPLNINLELLKNIYFYERFSELELNNILKINNYKIINDTNKYKVLRILTDNNIEYRQILNVNSLKRDVNTFFLLPDEDSFNKIPIDHLIKIFNLDEQELYNLKCDLFNKYLRKNIICNMYRYESI
jgi:hypothetical protein